MKFKCVFFTLTGLLISTFHSNQTLAGTLHLEYKSFYSHLKKLNDEELALLQFAFGFQHVISRELCQVKSVLIKTDKKDIPVVVGTDWRFVLPSEKALKQANAEVFVELEEPDEQCDLSVKLQIEPEDFASGVTAEKLRIYHQAFVAFFDEMGGILSFMMPSPKGLIISLSQGLPEKASGSTLMKKSTTGQYKLAHEDIAKIDFQLNDVKSVTAWMP